jgi:hypothetical protein
MRRATLVLGLLLLGTVLVPAGGSSAQNHDDFLLFWRKFKTAVIKGDRKSVARLTKFPVSVAEGVPYIQNSAELNRRFGELFNQQTDAARCFASKQPEVDTENSSIYRVVCPNQADNFVAYEFEQTKRGWQFIHRQFPTTCRCR